MTSKPEEVDEIRQLFDASDGAFVFRLERLNQGCNKTGGRQSSGKSVEGDLAWEWFGENPAQGDGTSEGVAY